MATTNLDVITDALRLLGVLHEVETPSPEQGSHGLRRLNQMIEAWTEDDVQLGYFEQDSLPADIPVPKWAERGVVSKLAQDLHATYPSGVLVPWVLDDSQNGYGTILRKCLVEKIEPANMDHMPMGSGHYGAGWDIETDR